MILGDRMFGDWIYLCHCLTLARLFLTRWTTKGQLTSFRFYGSNISLTAIRPYAYFCSNDEATMAEETAVWKSLAIEFISLPIAPIPHLFWMVLRCAFECLLKLDGDFRCSKPNLDHWTCKIKSEKQSRQLNNKYICKKYCAKKVALFVRFFYFAIIIIVKIKFFSY